MITKEQPKQKLFKTAWSTLFKVFVKITHAHTDDRGEWIFTCDGPDGINNHLFRACELERFCL